MLRHSAVCAPPLLSTASCTSHLHNKAVLAFLQNGQLSIHFNFCRTASTCISAEQLSHSHFCRTAITLTFLQNSYYTHISAEQLAHSHFCRTASTHSHFCRTAGTYSHFCRTASTSSHSCRTHTSAAMEAQGNPVKMLKKSKHKSIEDLQKQVRANQSAVQKLWKLKEEEKKFWKKGLCEKEVGWCGMHKNFCDVDSTCKPWDLIPASSAEGILKDIKINVSHHAGAKIRSLMN